MIDTIVCWFFQRIVLHVRLYDYAILSCDSVIVHNIDINMFVNCMCDWYDICSATVTIHTLMHTLPPSVTSHSKSRTHPNTYVIHHYIWYLWQLSLIDCSLVLCHIWNNTSIVLFKIIKYWSQHRYYYVYNCDCSQEQKVLTIRQLQLPTHKLIVYWIYWYSWFLL